MRVHLGCRRIVWLAGLVAIAAQSRQLQAQVLHVDGDRPSFEVATVKLSIRMPSPPPSDGNAAPPRVKVSPIAGTGRPTSRIHLILPPSLLIASAYNLPAGSENRRILNRPEWLQQDIEQYAIEAKIDDTLFAAMQKMTAAQQWEQVALMEQSLLAERFKLKVHFETREMPVYALTIAKGGSKLTPADESESSKLSMLGEGQALKLSANAVTLGQLVLSPFLTGSVQALVLDQTGLKGAYDLTLTWTAEPVVSADGPPSVFEALQEQLGLKLAPTKAPVEVVVVDHIERPSAN